MALHIDHARSRCLPDNLAGHLATKTSKKPPDTDNAEEQAAARPPPPSGQATLPRHSARGRQETSPQSEEQLDEGVACRAHAS